MTTPRRAALGIRVLLAFLRVSSRLPHRVLMGMGWLAGQIVFHSARRRRDIARRNLALCFPNLAEAKRIELLRAHFASLGRALFEAGLAYWASDDRLRKLVTFHGLPNLKQAHANGRGVILIAAHFTAMELGGRMLGLAAEFDAVIRPFSDPVIDGVVRAGRQRGVQNVIPKASFRRFLEGLRDNRAVLMTIDQATTARSKVMAPFFGVAAPTSINAARIAEKTGARVLPVLWIREPDLKGYRIEIGSPLANFPSGDAMADAIRLNAVVEEQIRRAPEQYYWIHRRFKSEPSPYEAT